MPLLEKPTDQLKMMNSINKQINSSVKYRPGQEGWQLNDLRDGGEGDCDSYAWTKYHLLKEAGLKPDNMSFVSLKLPDGRDHLVLRAAENGKYYYMDNRSDVMWNEPEGEITGVYYENNLRDIKNRKMS